MQGEDGGAEGNRTPDLLIANEALYQLSYGPRRAADKVRGRAVSTTPFQLPGRPAVTYKL